MCLYYPQTVVKIKNMFANNLSLTFAAFCFDDPHLFEFAVRAGHQENLRIGFRRHGFLSAQRATGRNCEHVNR